MNSNKTLQQRIQDLETLIAKLGVVVEAGGKHNDEVLSRISTLERVIKEIVGIDV